MKYQKFSKKVARERELRGKGAAGSARLWSDLFGKSGHNERIMTL